MYNQSQIQHLSTSLKYDTFNDLLLFQTIYTNVDLI